MLKKIMTVIYITILLLILFAIQMFVINNKVLFGIKPNLILISVIVVSSWYGEKIGGIFSFLIGLIMEFLFNANGIFVVAYTIIGILVGIFNTNYNKENKISLIYVTIFATFLFEFIEYLYYLVSHKVFTNFFYFLRQITISSILNIIIVFIVYSAVAKIVEYFDDRLRKNLSGF